MPETQSFQLKQFDLYNGDCKVFTTSTSGGNYYVKIRVPGNPNGIRKSLKTKDEKLARHLAEQEYINVRARIQNGQAIFQPKLKELVEDYINLKQLDVDVGHITKGRHDTIKTQLRHLERFVGDTYKSVLAINFGGDLFKTYYKFRKDNNPEVNSTTLINEASTISAVYKEGVRTGKIPFTSIPSFARLTKSGNRREALSIKQLKLITDHMRTKKFLNYDTENYHRYFIRDFTLLLSNTGLRFGEARRLKWKHVKVLRRGLNDKNKWLCEVNLKPEMTKNRKERQVQGRAGYVLERIKTYSNYTKQNDYIFVDNHSGNPLDKHYYYRSWDSMLIATGLDKANYPITYYNLRHTYATLRLYAGVDPYTLSKNLGTGLNFLQEHYGQVQTRKLRDELTKDLTKKMMKDLREESE